MEHFDVPLGPVIVQEASSGVRLTYLRTPTDENTVSTTINSSKTVEAAMQAIGSTAVWFFIGADGTRSPIDNGTPVANLIGADVVRYRVSALRQAQASSAGDPAKSSPVSRPAQDEPTKDVPPPKTPPKGPPAV